MTYESIYTNIRTTAERGMVYAAIETLIESLFKKGSDRDKLIETEMPSAVVRPLKQALAKLADTSVASVQTYLEGLRESLDALRVLSLEIAFDPTEESIAVFIAWIREYLGDDVVMEISIDHGLFGGARVSYEGRYKEINLSILIERIMHQQQASIHNIIEQASPSSPLGKE